MFSDNCSVKSEGGIIVQTQARILGVSKIFIEFKAKKKKKKE
jgi:hypothetical protein